MAPPELEGRWVTPISPLPKKPAKGVLQIGGVSPNCYQSSSTQDDHTLEKVFGSKQIPAQFFLCVDLDLLETAKVLHFVYTTYDRTINCSKNSSRKYEISYIGLKNVKNILYGLKTSSTTGKHESKGVFLRDPTLFQLLQLGQNLFLPSHFPEFLFCFDL